MIACGIDLSLEIGDGISSSVRLCSGFDFDGFQLQNTKLIDANSKLFIPFHVPIQLDICINSE